VELSFPWALIFLGREYERMLENPIERFASQLASVRRSQLRLSFVEQRSERIAVASL